MTIPQTVVNQLESLAREYDTELSKPIAEMTRDDTFNEVRAIMLPSATTITDGVFATDSLPIALAGKRAELEILAEVYGKEVFVAFHLKCNDLWEIVSRQLDSTKREIAVLAQVAAAAPGVRVPQTQPIVEHMKKALKAKEYNWAYVGLTNWIESAKN